MPTSRLPLEIKWFLIEYIDSVSHLEVLLMLYSNPDRQWDALSVSKELRSNISAATNQLENLREKGMISVNDHHQYYYEPTLEFHERIKMLFDLYHYKPVAVISCLYEKPTDKLKGFADAFKIKKD